jgi:uncharacterized protein
MMTDLWCAASFYGPPRDGYCFKQALFWGLWLLWPLLAWLLWCAWHRQGPWGWARWAPWGLVLATTLVFVHMRFVERHLIVERHTELVLGFDARLAVVSDLHVGLFKDTAFVERVVAKLNALNVDAVLIAGDWTYEPSGPLLPMLQPLAQLRHVALSVPGNHDEEVPGPPIQKALREALMQVGVKPIEGTHHRFSNFTVVGLGEHWVHKDGPEPLQRAPKDKPIVVLVHQPDSMMAYPKGSAHLSIAGHTHGGQVRFPFIGAVMNASQHPFDRGLHTFTPDPVFVTSGLGEVGLPLRLLNPPVIDVLKIR